MMRKLTYLFIIMGMLSLAIFAIADTDTNKVPTLFDLEWGSSPKECNKKGMKTTEGNLVIETGSVGYIDVKNADRKIGTVKLTTVGYFFVNDKLSSIICNINNPNDFETLRRTLFKKYGPPHIVVPIIDKYGNSNGTRVIRILKGIYIGLEFNIIKGKGMLAFNDINISHSEDGTKRPNFKTNYL